MNIKNYRSQLQFIQYHTPLGSLSLIFLGCLQLDFVVFSLFSDDNFCFNASKNETSVLRELINAEVRLAIRSFGQDLISFS